MKGQPFFPSLKGLNAMSKIAFQEHFKIKKKKCSRGKPRTSWEANMTTAIRARGLNIENAQGMRT